MEGATPLHSAALGGCARCAAALLEAGADRSLQDLEGRVPADLAAPEDASLRELLKPKFQSAVAAAAAAAAAKAAAGAKAGGSWDVADSAQAQFCDLTQVCVRMLCMLCMQCGAWFVEKRQQQHSCMVCIQLTAHQAVHLI